MNLRQAIAVSKYAEKNGFSNVKINDGHWHISRHRPVEESFSLMNKAADYLGIDKVALLSYEYADDVGIDNSSNLKALYFKDRGEGRYYSFAAITHFGDERDNAENFLRQAQLYYDLGFDGIKILEGKTDYHRHFNCKFDGERYEPLFSFLEEKRFPVVMHIGHFVPFPDCENTKERDLIQGEMLNVLKKHPHLPVVFAHMFNMVHNRPHLEKILETYPDVFLDLALGGDFFIRFSEDIDGWREFFRKFGDRVIFGTDTYNSYFSENDDFEITTRYAPIRKFFESSEPFTATYYDISPAVYGENVVLIPALLPENVVENVYVNSFVKAFGSEPRKTDREKSKKYCEDVLAGYKNGTLKSSLTKPLPPWLEEAVRKNAQRAEKLAFENIAVIKEFYGD